MEQMISNKEKAIAVLKAIETGASEPIAFINAKNYKQHNLGVEDGLDGFGRALAGLANFPEAAKVNTVRAFEDGDYVVCQTEYNFFGPKAGFDIFRFEDGLIVEHWDNLMPYNGEKNPSGRTEFDGTTEITDLDKTAENKALVENFVRDILKGENPNNLPNYFDGNNYIQHNPQIADNLDGLGAALAAMAEQGIKMEYFTIHKVLGCGNFVLAVSEGAFAGNPTSYYDLFRVENGKIAEHWDVMETIAPKSEWKHQNGKYEFPKYMDRQENIRKVIEYLMAENHVSHQIPASLEEQQRMMRALMNVWEPRAISQEFAAMEDAELQMQREDKGVVTIEGEGLRLWQGDITRLQVDAIVNAANAQALGCWAPLHNCIDNCIHSAAGIQLRKECADIMQGRLLKTGEAFITRGYNLPAKHVIHTVGPIIADGIPTQEQEEQLAQCYRSCLDLAEQHQLESIAFCCISTGVFHFPNERAAEIAVETVKSYPLNSVKTVVFNVFLDKDYDIYQKLL